MKLLLTGCLLLVAALPNAATAPQDVTFRLLNLERRCDQLQQRVDMLERQLQNQAIANAGAGDPNRELFLEMQRQQLSFNQQLLTVQQQQLELKKAFDQQIVRLQELEKRTPAPTPKPTTDNKPAPKPRG